MKRNLLIIALTVMMVMLSVSCQSTEPEGPVDYEANKTTKAQYVAELGKNGVPKPLWVDEILQGPEFDKKSYYWGVGFANYGTERATRQSAKTRAYNSIAEAIKLDLENCTIDFTEAGGDVFQSQTLENFDEHIIKKISVSMSDVEIMDTWTSADGSLYYLVRCDRNNVITEFERLLQAEIARQQMYQGLEFKLKYGLL